MKIGHLVTIEAEEGMMLTKNGKYAKSVLLRTGETEEGWSEITIEEYEAIKAEKLKQE